MMASQRNGLLYVGVTADLPRRVWEHRERIGSSFARRHGTKRLAWAERHEDIRTAIQRETSIKRWKRAYKVRLIHADNPEWDDLYERLKW
jgi:putative endonuclease